MQFNYFNMDQDKHMDTEAYQSIAVITSFQKDGKFIPLKAQIETEEGLVVLDITKIGKTEETKDLVFFDCMYPMDNSLRPLRMYYLKKQHQWVIDRIKG